MDLSAATLTPVRQIFVVEYSDSPRRPGVPVHMPTFCKFDVVLQGGVNLFTPEGRIFKLRPGVAALVPPLTSHGYESRGRLIHTVVKFQLHPRYRFVLGRRVRVIDVPPHVMATMRECGPLAMEGDPATAPLVQAAATYGATFALCAAAAQLSNDTSEDAVGTPLTEVIHLVTQSPTRPWTVAQLAEMQHLSESQFTKRFRAAFGQSPQQFLQETRMIAAADLLITTDRGVKRIAEACGYANVHGFTRAFSRVLGTPPAAYRRRMQVINA